MPQAVAARLPLDAAEIPHAPGPVLAADAGIGHKAWIMRTAVEDRPVRVAANAAVGVTHRQAERVAERYAPAQVPADVVKVGTAICGRQAGEHGAAIVEEPCRSRPQDWLRGPAHRRRLAQIDVAPAGVRPTSSVAAGEVDA